MDIVEEYNDLFSKINLAESYNELLSVRSLLKPFDTRYAETNKTEVERISTLFCDKLSVLIDESDINLTYWNDKVYKLSKELKDAEAKQANYLSEGFKLSYMKKSAELKLIQ